MAEIVPQEPGESRRPPILAIVLLIAAVVLGIYVGANVLGVLYAVIAPPMPPIPPGFSQVSHTSEAYGVDDWKYISSGDVCRPVQDIIASGATCHIAPLECGDLRDQSQTDSNGEGLIGRCDGQIAFSIFNEQWWELFTYKDGKPQLEVNREVYWIGTGPE